MSKTFTINIPDQLWLNSWTENKTESYTYSGPDTWNVLVTGTTNLVSEWSEDVLEASPGTRDFVVTLDATADATVPVAHYIHTQGADSITAEEREAAEEDETNHDDSVYKKNTNPLIHDYFDIGYDVDAGLQLVPIYKNTKTVAEEKAEKRIEYVKKYNDTYDFDADTQAIIDTFLSSMDTYKTSMLTVYPWKYTTIDENEIPKIPASIVTIFNTLPEVE
jgi:hypothetical protein|tara:strand:+ start:2083 stop:2742 length:660 start_codon:yes stop_codon:yes gene_type:complete